MSFRSIQDDGARRLRNYDIKVKENWYKIDFLMVPAKLAFFFQGAKDASYQPYLILFLKSIGLSSEDAGFINGIQTIGLILGNLMWGTLADSKNAHKLILTINCLFGGIFLISQPFMSSFVGLSSNNECKINQSNSTQSIGKETSIFTVNELKYLIAVINLVAQFFDGTSLGFVNAAVVRRIENSNIEAEFSHQRVFEAIGYGTGSLASSVALKYSPSWSYSCYLVVFLVYSYFLTGLFISTQILLMGDDVVTITKRTENKNKLVLNKVICTISQPSVLMFLITVAVGGYLSSLCFSFMYLFLTQLNASSILLGTSTFAASAFLVPCYLMLPSAMKKFRGTWNKILLGCFSWGLYLLAIGFLQNPWYIYLLNVIFQWSCVALFQVTIVEHVKHNISPEIYTAVFTICNSLFSGVGYMIANFTGGYLFDNYGGRTVYVVGASISILWCFTIVLYLFFRNRKSRKVMPIDAELAYITS